MPLNIAKVEITAPPRSVQNTFIEVIVLIVITGLFYWFLVMPKAATLATANAELTKLQDQQKSSSQDLKTLQSLIDKLKSSSSKVQQLDEALPLENNTIKLQTLIEYLAGTSGLTIGGVNVSSKSDTVLAGDKALLKQPFHSKRTLQKMAVSIFVTGSFDQLQTFMSKLQTSGRIIDVTSLDLNSSQQGQLGLRLSADSYYYIP